MRILSGVQSSGKLHLGNYFGAMKQHIDAQEEHECFIFIANFHALTTVQDAKRLAALTHDVALDYLALGLDPNKACLFRQSDVPEVTELAWILSTVTGKGLLERSVSYKDKISKGLTPSMGLFIYPILQAADILIYRSDAVPVGKDQEQHIEMTADMAGYFNNTYNCEVFVIPKAKLNDAAVVPGTDGEKMSKSYGNTIDLFGDPTAAKKRIMSVKTDSTPVDEPKDPEKCSVFALLRLFADADETNDWADRYRKGGMGYGEAKKRLVELFETTIGPARERRAKLADQPDRVEAALAAGGRRARELAQSVMRDVRQACGIVVARTGRPGG
ncbi:MAG: tryptophan--tRNA ligase [Planctomycetota bacterium]|nr:tryptophan--tRNA ligase [Planctomycetota bacterium]